MLRRFIFAVAGEVPFGAAFSAFGPVTPKGSEPGVLPIEHPAKSERDTYLNTARALWVPIQPSMTLCAAKVIL